ncbi:hypothetical protein Lesp01_07390 [Lentzea sp. NBRC 102530]|nr:hypothetical protein Lesp01_07390 [Lentzea sp. NBRC 102530]
MERTGGAEVVHDVAVHSCRDAHGEEQAPRRTSRHSAAPGCGCGAGRQRAVQDGFRPDPLPLPWKPNSVDPPAGTLAL